MKKFFSLILCSVMALAASATVFTKVTTGFGYRLYQSNNGS